MPKTSGSTIPTFAVVGEPNEGKTTLIATLAEADWLKIDARAGTTREKTSYTAEIDGQPVLKIFDTPGFENTPQLREWLEDHKDELGNLTDRFLAEHASQPRYRPECEILSAMKGAGVIYVVDGSREIRQEDRDQIEILRYCCLNRIAIINSKSAASTCLEDWRLLLSRAFTYREFNALEMGFKERMELLRAISVVMPEWKKAVEESIELYEQAWDDRLLACTTALMEFLKQVFSKVLSEPVEDERQVASVTATVTKRLKAEVKRVEERFRSEIRSLFLHTRTNWQLPDVSILTDDLFSDRVWKLCGLTKSQLIWAGAAFGAVIGGGIDLMFGGATFLLGSLVGGAAGAAGAWATSDKAVEIKTPSFWLRGLKIPGQRVVSSSNEVQARAQPSSNLTWILIDRAVIYTHHAANWSHGRQERTIRLPDSTLEKQGLTSRWTDEQRKPIIQWLGMICSQNAAPTKLKAIETKVEDFFLTQIRDAIQQPQTWLSKIE